MTLRSFFDVSSEAPVYKAFQALRGALNRHADSLPQDEFSPWTIRLGKGGPRSDGTHYDGPEKSLYRHCMDVATFAIWLLYYEWRSGKVVIEGETDLVATIQTIFAIAFAHDANKLVGDSSGCPTDKDVRIVYEMLDMKQWSGLTLDEMIGAAKLVEHRGLGQAVFGSARLNEKTLNLVRLVQTGDRITSRAQRTHDFIEIYNNEAKNLHKLYGSPSEPLRPFRFRGHPVILHHFFRTLEKRFFDNDLYPLLLVRQGEWLDVAFSEVKDEALFASWFDEFELILNEMDKEPSFQVAPTTGKVTLFHVHGPRDVLEAAKKELRQIEILLLRLSEKDWETAMPLAGFWIRNNGSPFGLCAKDPQKAFCPIFNRVDKDTDVSDEHPIWRAAALALIVNEKNMGRLLEMRGGIVRSGLDENVPGWQTLSSLSQRTIAALQASLVINDEEQLYSWLDEIHGSWNKSDGVDEGARAIVNALRRQAGFPVKEEIESCGTESGHCLLCGELTGKSIETSSMKLAGIKKTSFNNRIGHKKSLDSQTGANYICLSCEKIQGLIVRKSESLPMIVSTPVRSMFNTHAVAGSIEDIYYVSSFDAYNREKRKGIFPWEGDATFAEPLVFESEQFSLVDIVNQVHRFSVYAALSGEPVHAFIASQRKCNSSFLYEGIPTILRELVSDIENNDGGVGRNNLVRLIKRLDLFKMMLRQNGISELQSVSRFGWWAISHVCVRALSNNNMKEETFFQNIHLARKEFPMNEYDKILEKLVRSSVRIYLPRSNGSDNDLTFMLREALKVWQSQSVFDRETVKFAMANRLRSDISRRIGVNAMDDDLMEFAEAAIAIFEKGESESEMNSKFTRFLIDAYAGAYRQEANKEWERRKQVKKSGNDMKHIAVNQ